MNNESQRAYDTFAPGLHVGDRVDLVVLAGTLGTDAPWTHGVPRPLLPLPGTTILEALLARLNRGYNGSLALCANGHTTLYQQHLNMPSVTVFVEDHVPRGPAGCLKACEPHLSTDTVLLTGGSVWLEDDPAWMVEQHRKSGNTLTVFAVPASRRPGSLLAGRLRPIGVYCCDRVVLEHIKTHGYQDIKEQLIPALRKAGHRVGVVALRRPAYQVSDWQHYIHTLNRAVRVRGTRLAGFRQLAPDIFCGEGVEIAADARIVGPAVIGHGCRIESGALIVGPGMLGDRTHVGRNTWLTRVVGGDEVRFAAGRRFFDRLMPGPGGGSWALARRRDHVVSRFLARQADWLGQVRAMLSGLAVTAGRR